MPIGRPKAEVACEVARTINPKVEIELLGDVEIQADGGRDGEVGQGGEGRGNQSGVGGDAAALLASN